MDQANSFSSLNSLPSMESLEILNQDQEYLKANLEQECVASMHLLSPACLVKSQDSTSLVSNQSVALPCSQRGSQAPATEGAGHGFKKRVKGKQKTKTTANMDLAEAKLLKKREENLKAAIRSRGRKQATSIELENKVIQEKAKLSLNLKILKETKRRNNKAVAENLSLKFKVETKKLKVNNAQQRSDTLCMRALSSMGPSQAPLDATIPMQANPSQFFCQPVQNDTSTMPNTFGLNNNFSSYPLDFSAETPQDALDILQDPLDFSVEIPQDALDILQDPLDFSAETPQDDTWVPQAENLPNDAWENHNFPSNFLVPHAQNLPNNAGENNSFSSYTPLPHAENLHNDTWESHNFSSNVLVPHAQNLPDNALENSIETSTMQHVDSFDFEELWKCIDSIQQE